MTRNLSTNAYTTKNIVKFSQEEGNYIGVEIIPHGFLSSNYKQQYENIFFNKCVITLFILKITQK